MLSTFAIEFNGITKKYGNSLAVDNLNLSIPSGELFGFLGPNGAGKTTAMKIAAGLVRATGGKVKICGYDLESHSLEAKRLLGFVPESPYIYESLTGREFLHYCAGLYRLSNPVTLEKVEELCEGFGIGSWADRRAGEYSHGMKQRIVMASAFLHNPKVILIDEPMVGLDPAGVKLVKTILTSFCGKGGSVFLSTHTLTNAEELCDRVAIIKSGNVVKLDNMSELTDGNIPLEEVFLLLTSEDGGS